MKALGVTDHRFLGGFGRYSDSGMVWHEDGYAVAGDDRPANAFWDADLTEAATLLVEVIREVRPQVMSTYDQFGNYGHPDHIQAHRVATYAADLAAVPTYRPDLGEAWQISKIYWQAMSESRWRRSLRAIRAAGDTTAFEGMDPEGPLPMATPDADLAAEVDGSAYADQKIAALHAHRTQIERRRTVLRPVQQRGQRGARHRVLPHRQGHPGPGRAPTVSRTTSSPASEPHGAGSRSSTSAPPNRRVPPRPGVLTPSISLWRARPGETTGRPARARAAGWSSRSSSGSPCSPAVRTPRPISLPGDKVPVGTNVAGVDIGGTRPDVCRAGCCARGSPTARDTPFTVVINGRSQQVQPVAGRPRRRLRRLGRKAGAERSWRPSRLWRYFTDGSTYQPVVTLDQERLAALIRRLDVTDGRTATDGARRLPPPDVHDPPSPSWTDRSTRGGRHGVLERLPHRRTPRCSCASSPTTPAIDTAAIHRFVKRFANPAMASPVELQLGHSTLHLSPSDYGDLLVARHAPATGSRPAVQARRPARVSRARRSPESGPTSRSPPPSPSSTAAPSVVKAQARREVPVAATSPPRCCARSRRPHRTARVRGDDRRRASFTNADARQLGIRRRWPATPCVCPRGTRGADARGCRAPPRRHGAQARPVALAARPARPGDAVRPGRRGPGHGGVQRRLARRPPGGPPTPPDPSYAGSAPLGRDASLGDGHDLAFTDDTRYGVLVSAVAGPATASQHGTLTVTLWSTPRWTVTSSHGPRSHVVRSRSPGRRHEGVHSRAADATGSR